MVPIMHRQIYFSYLHMEPEPGFIFKNICSLANLNSRNNFFLHIKLLRKGVQEKLYFNNIVSIESTFLAN